MIQPNVWTCDDCEKFSAIIMPHLEKQWANGFCGASIPLKELREILKDSFPKEANSLRKHLIEFLEDMFGEMDLISHVGKYGEDEYRLSVNRPTNFKYPVIPEVEYDTPCQ